MSSSSKDPGGGAGDSSRKAQHDEQLTKELNTMFGELRQATPIDARNPFDFGRFCQEVEQQDNLTKRAEQSKVERKLTEVAEQFKVEGNRLFKQNNYRKAIHAYTQGLKIGCPDVNLNSILYSNRAAAFKQSGDLQLAFRDCICAIKLNCANYKAVFRGAECLAGLSCFSRCAEWGFWVKLRNENCGITVDDANYAAFLIEYTEFLKRTSSRVFEEKKRFGYVDSTAPNSEGEKRVLLAAFKERRYRFDPSFSLDDVAAFKFESIHLEPLNGMPINEQRVYVDPQDLNRLIWPLIRLSYYHPQAGAFFELFVTCKETLTLDQLFSPHFDRPFPWDSTNDHRPENMVYLMPLGGSNFANDKKMKQVPSTMMLRDALATPGYIIVRGLPMIFAYTKQQLEDAMMLSMVE